MLAVDPAERLKVLFKLKVENHPVIEPQMEWQEDKWQVQPTLIGCCQGFVQHSIRWTPPQNRITFFFLFQVIPKVLKQTVVVLFLSNVSVIVQLENESCSTQV